MMENGGLGMPLDKTLPPAVSERVYFVNARKRVFVFTSQDTAVASGLLPWPSLGRVYYGLPAIWEHKLAVCSSEIKPQRVTGLQGTIAQFSIDARFG